MTFALSATPPTSAYRTLTCTGFLARPIFKGSEFYCMFLCAVARLVQAACKASSAALGLRAITVNKRGRSYRVAAPCSQSRNVPSGMPKRLENSCCVKPRARRMILARGYSSSCGDRQASKAERRGRRGGGHDFVIGHGPHGRIVPICLAGSSRLAHGVSRASLI